MKSGLMEMKNKCVWHIFFSGKVIPHASRLVQTPKEAGGVVNNKVVWMATLMLYYNRANWIKWMSGKKIDIRSQLIHIDAENQNFCRGWWHVRNFYFIVLLDCFSYSPTWWCISMYHDGVHHCTWSVSFNSSYWQTCVSKIFPPASTLVNFVAPFNMIASSFSLLSFANRCSMIVYIIMHHL